jgi:hypothetical protein
MFVFVFVWATTVVATKSRQAMGAHPVFYTTDIRNSVGVKRLQREPEDSPLSEANV